MLGVRVIVGAVAWYHCLERMAWLDWKGYNLLLP